MNTVKFIGMDVHKKTITIAIADEGRQNQPRIYGTIANDLDALDKFCRKMVSTSTQLYFVYEAGPCGYGIYRHLTQKGFACIVAAPSMIPKKSGDRIKNDHRDAAMLARLHRSGELTAVYVPNTQDEAMRDLSRAREDAVTVAKKAKQRLKAFLLRNSIVFTGRSQWSKAYFSWLADIAMPHPAQQVALQEYIDAVHESLHRVDRLTDQIRQMIAGWRLAPMVSALQAARGVSLVVAVTALAELGDLSRFKTPSQLMAHLGLVPSEHSVVTASREVVSPKPVMATPEKHWWKPPGHTGCKLESAVCSSSARRICRNRFVESHGKPNFACVPIQEAGSHGKTQTKGGYCHCS